MKQRDSNIEFLRCVMMFVIVLGHMSAMGPYSGVKAVHAIFSLSYFATDSFVFISGWYGMRFSWRKVLYLLGLGLFASLFLSAFSFFALGRICFNYSLGWFGNAYLALLFASPIINAGLQKLEECGNLVSAWILLTVACLLSWLPGKEIVQLAPPGWTGNSTMSLVFVYITGRVFSSVKCINGITLNKALCLFTIFTLINIAWAATAMRVHGNAFLESIFVETRCNNSPITIALAFAVFLVFKNLRVPQLLGAIASCVAPSLMSIYLLHIGAFPEVSKRLFYDYAFIPANSESGKFLSFVMAAVVVFTSCLCVDVIRRGFSASFKYYKTKLSRLKCADECM